MNVYTQENPPKSGNARKIWKQFHELGIVLTELHYNPNNWGRDHTGGWGNWACTIDSHESVNLIIFAHSNEWLCGLSDGRAYIERLEAPHSRYWLESTINK